MQTWQELVVYISYQILTYCADIATARVKKPTKVCSKLQKICTVHFTMPGNRK